MRRAWPLVLLPILGAAWLLRSGMDRRERPSGRSPVGPQVAARVDGPVSVAERGEKEKPVIETTPEPRQPVDGRAEDAVPAPLLWLMKQQNLDGSWGDGLTTLDGRPIDRVGMTSLALLAFMSHGYSHLSKDSAEGIHTGDVVRRALEWLMRNEGPEGRFSTSGDPTLSQALATLALSEMYGLTGSDLFKESAQNAVRAFAAMQGPDGSWGDLFQSVWAAETLTSARLSGLAIEDEVVRRAGGYYKALLDAGPNLPAMVGHIFVNRDKEHPSLAETTAWLSSTPPRWSQQSFSYWYLGSLALFQQEGPEGALWKNWGESLKQTLLPSRQGDGTWAGASPAETLVRTSLGQLTIAIYYRYGNVSGK